MSLAELLQLLHVLSAFAFVTGLIGRDVTIAMARRATDLGGMRTFLDAASPFDRFLVVPGTFAVLVLGILTWWAEKLPLWGTGTRWVTVSLLIFLSNAPLVPLVFIHRGKVFEEALAGSVEAGTRTPALEAAFADPVAVFARWYELASVAMVIALMVVKPF